MADSGTEDDGEAGAGGAGGWFMVEAIVRRRTGDAPSSDEDDDGEGDLGQDMVDFIDNRPPGDGQEVAQQLYVQQEQEADEAAVLALKRKLLSPYVSPSLTEPCIDNDLSPRLDAITIGRRSRKAKRRLFEVPDSGYGDTQVDTDTRPSQVQGTEEEGEHGRQEVAKEVEGRGGGDGAEEPDAEQPATQTGAGSVLSLLKTSNLRACLLGKFKDLFGVGFMELVRQFKSNQTACSDWVVCGFGIYCTVAEGVKQLIQPQVLYAHMQTQTCTWGMVMLMLLRFKCAKNRNTVAKTLSTLLNIPESHMLIEPPKLRSPPAALYWYRMGISNASEVVGDTPEWIAQQTMVGHSMHEVQFSLSEMVQFAYDHDITEESLLAYEYALIADEDANAAAFLGSNCQAKYVKDAVTMCRHYKQAEMSRMNMSEWIDFRISKIEGEGDWRQIVMFLRHQNIEFISFLCSLKAFLKGTPKKSCIVLYGPPDTGKSYFGMSLLHFLGGAVISYANSSSHFWLQPLCNHKIGLLDDATTQCWNYVDTYLRNALDGNAVCIDRKHKSLLQIKCPPLIITSNVNPAEDDRWRYLRSRLTVFKFLNAFPLTSKGDPVYTLNDANWKCFFLRLWSRLDLKVPEDPGKHGDDSQPFRCVPGSSARPL
ncbi:E1 [Macaca mulatta papillomavirus 3]|uniref:Replication protein E1 n=1 Tax=Macaca mulatta papillomavirus 3 TaxID=2294151 RepID=A0A385AGY9_9PAPI|nr:E1 [Macaca mulatta papillomavirus 3]AXN57289.1 E1 [Macaca mulatta papillomavirus 3]